MFQFGVVSLETASVTPLRWQHRGKCKTIEDKVAPERRRGKLFSKKLEVRRKRKLGRAKKVEMGKLKKAITVVEGRLKKTVWSSKERTRTQL